MEIRFDAYDFQYGEMLLINLPLHPELWESNSLQSLLMLRLDVHWTFVCPGLELQPNVELQKCQNETLSK
jgi:hypothetical protein